MEHLHDTLPLVFPFQDSCAHNAIHWVNQRRWSRFLGTLLGMRCGKSAAIIGGGGGGIGGAGMDSGGFTVPPSCKSAQRRMWSDEY